MKIGRTLALGIAGATLALGGSAVSTTVSAADYYEGKTINVIIGRRAGSASDATARSFMKYWQKHIPGHPTLVAKHMRGTASWNFMTQKADPDGLTVSFTPYDPVSQITKLPAFKADFSKLVFVGSLYNPPLVYVRTDVMKKPEDFKMMKGAKYGGQQPNGRFDVFGRITLEMLNADYRYLTGYGNAGKVLQAMRRGEVDIQTIGLNLYRLSAEDALVKTGKAIPLYYFPWPGNTNLAASLFGDIPSFDDYYKKIHGKAPSGEKYEMFKWMTTTLNAMAYSAFLPPGTDAKYAEILRKAYTETVNDPEYKAEQKKMFGFNLPYIDAPLGKEIITAMVNATPEQKTFLVNFLAEGAKHKVPAKK
jgi:putative tricarboxylic transport membrane protein